jgi:hypothetical protein
MSRIKKSDYIRNFIVLAESMAQNNLCMHRGRDNAALPAFVCAAPFADETLLAEQI